MIFHEIIGIKKSNQLFFYPNHLVVKQKKGFNSTFIEACSLPYSQIGEMPVKQNFVSTVVRIGNEELSFVDAELIETVKGLIKLGQQNPQLLAKYVGEDHQQIELETINKTSLYKDISSLPTMPQPIAPQPAMAHVPPQQSAPMTAAPQKSSMFSPELERLIEATLEDGILEDHEKAALVRRAQAEGVDILELEIYINSILQKRQREEQNAAKNRAKEREKEKQAKFGRVCPNCGKQIPPMTIKCECGYEVTNANQTVSSVKLLSEKIANISTSGLSDVQRAQSIRELVSTFPVPNTKEDIIDFLSLSVSNAKQDAGAYGIVMQRMKNFGIGFAAVFVLVELFFLCFGNMRDVKGMAGVLVFLGVIIGAIVFFKALKLAGSDATDRLRNSKVWKAKFNQVLMKGRALRGDSDFQKQLDYFQEMMEEK